MASMTLSPNRLSRRERRLGHQEMPRWDAQSRAQARREREQRMGGQRVDIGSAAQNSIHLLAKLSLIALISIVFLYFASTILSTSVGLPIKAIALGLWSCGFVPVSHYLWNS